VVSEGKQLAKQTRSGISADSVVSKKAARRGKTIGSTHFPPALGVFRDRYERVMIYNGTTAVDNYYY